MMKHRVNKRFDWNGRTYEPGEVEDFSGVRNERRLLSQKYITIHTGDSYFCEVCVRTFDKLAFGTHREVHPPPSVKKKPSSAPQ